jgi:hypothetical protein
MTTDMFGLAVAPYGSGYLSAFTDLFDQHVHLLEVDAAFGMNTNVQLTNFEFSTRALATSSAGTLLVGTSTAGGVGVLSAASALQGFGTPSPVDTMGGDANPSITAMGADFLVAWESPAPGPCEVARVAFDGTVLAGPLAMMPPGANHCGRPLAVALSGGGVVIGMHDATGTNPIAYAAAADSNLTAATTAVAVGDTDSDVFAVIDGGDRAYVAARTNGDSRLSTVMPTGVTTTLGADFGLSGNDGDSQTLVLLGGALIHVRTESGMLQARKICR